VIDSPTRYEESWRSLIPDMKNEIYARLDGVGMCNLLRAKDNTGCIELLRRFDTILVDFGLTDPPAFRNAMKTYNVIVAGSVPLSVLLPFDNPLRVGDIDCYLSSDNFQPFVGWLTTNSSYVEVSRRVFHPLQLSTNTPSGSDDEGLEALYDTVSGANTLNSVTTFKNPSGQRLQVICTKSKSAMVAVAAFHSTAVMNAVFHFGVVSLYSDLTLAKRGLQNSTGYVLGRAGLRPRCITLALAKYANRGFDILPDHSSFSSVQAGRSETFEHDGHACGVWAYCPKTHRHSLDHSTLRLPFPGWTELQMLREMPDISWKLAHNGKCQLGPTDYRPGWIKDIDGTTYCTSLLLIFWSHQSC
jgi:hypothetical protein